MQLSRLITCVVAGIDYLVHPQVLGTVEEAIVGDSLIPVVLLSESELEAGPVELGKTLRRIVEVDDVCSEEFTAILVVKPPSGPAPESESGYAGNRSIHHVSSFGFNATYRLSPVTAAKESHSLSSGPYFLSGRNLHQAWRLYPDHLKAFEFGMIPDDVSEPDSYRAVSSLTQDGMSVGIPVPSRLYHQPSSEKPLSGARVGLKDIISVKGVKTTVSSLAYSELYLENTEHAPFTKDLIETGAVIVGKTKTSQFSTATQWIDFHRPRNPRGDLYQDPSGSSTGGAAALAGYDWLDHSVGGDSSGSIREPSTWHGLFGIRPTFGTSSLEGVVINSPRYDTIGMFGRSLEDLYSITQETLAVEPDDGQSAGRILYPLDFYPLDDQRYQELTEEFVVALEKSLGTTRTPIKLAEIWSTSPPRKARGQEMQEYMDKAPFLSMCYDYSRQYQPFVDEYREKFERDPFIENYPLLRWGIGANITEAEYDEYLERIEVFREWFAENIMAETGPLSDSILVLPYGIAEPQYVDEPQGPPLVFQGINPKLLAPVLGTPHLVAPFAQVPYESRISRQTEYRPICGTVMSTKGNDLMLIRTVRDTFKTAGWRSQIDTGRFTFPVGNNPRSVDDGEIGVGSVGSGPVLRTQL